MIETSLDAVLGGRLRLHQPRKGHRVGFDAMALAAAVRFSGDVIDLGCGVGSAGLAFAMLNPNARVLMVDRDRDCVTLADRNIAENGLSERVTTIEADVFSAEAERQAAGLRRDMAGLVLTNPPFFEAGAGRLSPNEKKRSAHILDGGSLDDWLRAAASCLAPTGRLVVIHRADAITTILAAMSGRFGAIALKFVHPVADAAANRVLVHAVKASRAPLSVLPPIVLADPAGAPTPAMDAINQGSGEPWFP